ncbi:hypothetical protein C8Q80DRAFT_1275701 [Daedaleopsis nitida]|nr:hypothetical protein C8Q80DRAFT_1275701 [Daedaleopsis nitida]
MAHIRQFISVVFVVMCAALSARAAPTSTMDETLRVDAKWLSVNNRRDLALDMHRDEAEWLSQPPDASS